VTLGPNDSRGGEHVKPFRHQAENRLFRVETASSLVELGALRSNRLEKLKGNRKGQWSIRINDQWRICFKWADGMAGPGEVEIVDYH
jgi:proteic killer suppression protein